MQSTNAYNERLREWKLYAYSFAEVFASASPAILLGRPVISLPILAYGASDGLTRMETGRGISERIGNGIVFIYRYLKKKL